MDLDSLKRDWLAEESIAHIHGWDFSHISGRHVEEGRLPWDYKTVILQYLTPEMKLLDIDTGGGEFLLSLNHPHSNTAATEGYPPNVELCRRVLSPLGIDIRDVSDISHLPFDDSSFDIVINRHGDLHPTELRRVLRPGGMFITQQVGAQNDRELAELLLPGTPMPFPDNHLAAVSKAFEDAGFEILQAQETFRPVRFYDVGALVWFARIIEWEFPGFSVEGCLPRLIEAQRILEEHGSIDGRIHRFLIAARKP